LGKALTEAASTESLEQIVSNRHESDETMAKRIAVKYLDALASEVRNDPDAFMLQETLQRAGARLVHTLESLRYGQPDWFRHTEVEAERRESLFLEGFVRQVAGTGGLVADAMARQAAASCGERLLGSDGPLLRAVREAPATDSAYLSDELFCLVFELFFKKALANFVTTIIAGKVSLALPLLHVVDPAGKIAEWAGEQVAARIPDPCKESEGLTDKPSLAELADGLVAETVKRAIGLPLNGSEATTT
jgi:hypothetical protein